MGRERVVVVGGGAAGLRAAERLRELNFGGELVVIGEEPYRTYHRPGLTKHLMTGVARPRELVLPVLTELDAIWRYGVRASHLEPDEHVLHLPGGEEITYDGLVIATGSQARHLPGAPRHDARVHVVRTVADAVAVQKNLRRGRGGLAVIGSGFLACELASAARSLGRDATIITKDTGLLTNVPGADLGETVTALHDAHGVQIVTEAEVHHWVRQTDGIAMHLTTGQVVVASCVVLAVGAVPAVSWLRGSGLILDDGVMCDATCHAIGAEDIVVAGDVARWPNLRFDTHPRRVEHWLNAVEMGRAAAENLLVGAASAKPYTPLPRFWTDQHGMRIQAAGLPALAQDTVPLAGSVNVGHRVTGYVSNGELVGVMGFDSPRGMLHWTAELETRTTEAMEKRPAPARRAPAVQAPPVPSIAEAMAEGRDDNPATQAIPVYAMSAMEAAAAMDAALARGLGTGGSTGRDAVDVTTSMPPVRGSLTDGAALGPGRGGPANSGPAMSSTTFGSGSAGGGSGFGGSARGDSTRGGSGGGRPRMGGGHLGPEDSWPSMRPARRSDSPSSVPDFGPLDSPLGPEDSWPSMPAAGSGKSWPELPSVQAMDSWLSMPAVDSAPRLPIVRKPDSPPPPSPASSQPKHSASESKTPTVSEDSPQGGRRARAAMEVTASIPPVGDSTKGRRARAVDETQSIPVVRETNMTRSERRARAAEVTTSIPPVRSESSSSRTKSPWPSTAAPSEPAAGPAMTSVPAVRSSGRHASPDPDPAERPPTPLEVAQTGEMPAVRPTTPRPPSFSAAEPAPESRRSRRSGGRASGEVPSAPGTPPAYPTGRADSSSRRLSPAHGSPAASSSGFPPVGGGSRGSAASSSGFAPARDDSRRLPSTASAGGDSRGLSPMASSSGFPPVREGSRGVPPTASSSGFAPVRDDSRRLGGDSRGLPPTASSPGFPPVRPDASSRGMPPARGDSRGLPSTASSPGFPPVRPDSSSRGLPPTASSSGFPPARGLPPTASSPGFAPVRGDSRGLASSSGFPPVRPDASSRGMPPAGRGLPPTASSSGFAPVRGESRGLPPTASSPGFPPVRPDSSSRGMPPAATSSGFAPVGRGLPPTASSPGFPPVRPDSRGLPPTASSPGFPPVRPDSRGMPPAASSSGFAPVSRGLPPTASSPGFPPVRPDSRGFPPNGSATRMPPPVPIWPTASSPGFPPAHVTSPGMRPLQPPVRPTFAAPGSAPVTGPIPAIATAPPADLVPDTPPRDRVFASVQTPEIKPQTTPEPERPSFPPAPTFPPPSSRAAGTPPAGRAAPKLPLPPPPSPDRDSTASRARKSRRRRSSAMPPPGTVSALPPVSRSDVPGIEDPSRYEEITPSG